MNNLQLIAWAKRVGKLIIHNPSPRCQFYTCVVARPVKDFMGATETISVSHESLPIALDLACEHLRGEALVQEPRMAH